MKKIHKLLIILFALFFLTACQKEDTNSKDKTIVYTTTAPIYDFTKEIVADKMEVRNILEGVTSAHSFEPTSDLIIELAKAKALLVNGAGMELWLHDLEDSLPKDMVLVDCSEYVNLLPAVEHHHEEIEDEHDHEEEEEEHQHEMEDEHGHDHGEFDPHYWFSLSQSQNQAKKIFEAIVALDPENKEFYQKNFDQLNQKFDEMEEKYTKALEKYKGKAFIVPHRAFSYLAKEYDLIQISIEGILAEGQPNAKRIAEIIEEAKKYSIKAVFYDKNGSSKSAETIAEELGVETLPIHTLESLTKEEVKAGENYFSLMEKNLDNLLKAFGDQI